MFKHRFILLQNVSVKVKKSLSRSIRLTLASVVGAGFASTVCSNSVCLLGPSAEYRGSHLPLATFDDFQSAQAERDIKPLRYKNVLLKYELLR